MPQICKHIYACRHHVVAYSCIFSNPTDTFFRILMDLKSQNSAPPSHLHVLLFLLFLAILCQESAPKANNQDQTGVFSHTHTHSLHVQVMNYTSWALVVGGLAHCPRPQVQANMYVLGETTCRRLGESMLTCSDCLS